MTAGPRSRQALADGSAKLSKHLPVVLATLWLLVVGLAYLAPALARGVHLGPYDLLGVFGLGTIPGIHPYNVVASDQIGEMAPWATLAWREVHSGHVPLWNPYSGMGLPFAFDFQSATFSLPMLVGYLFPSGLVYTVAIVVKLFIAGTGALFLGRVLELDVVPATFAATVFELSGAFTGWLGWPQSGVFCFLGWLIGAGILVLRTRRRSAVALFSLSLAFAVYGGHPEGLAIALCAVVVVLGVVLASMIAASRKARPLGAVLRLGVSAVLGLALASPLLLPGTQLLSSSLRNSGGTAFVLPKGSLVNFAFAGFYGFPVSHSQYFGPVNWYETAAYVGPIALVLAVLGVWRYWRRPELTAMAVSVVAMGFVVYSVSVAKFMVTLPGSEQIIWTRALVVMDFFIAVLAGAGLHAVMREGRTWRVQWRLGTLALVAALGLGLVYLHSNSEHLSAAQRSIRNHSFLWPLISVAVVLAVAGALALWGRAPASPTVDPSQSGRSGGRHRRRDPRVLPAVGCAVVLAGVGSAFLLTAAPQLEPGSPSGFVATAAEAQLQRAVGTARVGFSSCPSLGAVPSLGILPEANDAYAVSELSAFDPIVPGSYVSAWSQASGTPPQPTQATFCPSVADAALARDFGVAYILAPAGAPAPAGTQLVSEIGGEGLYRVPGSGIVTVLGAGTGEQPVAFHYVDNHTIGFTVDTTGPSTLHLHITDVPGWSATVDGHPLALERWGGAMLSATLRPGAHHVTLEYWPPRFTEGLVLAGVALVLILVGLLVPRRRARGRGTGTVVSPP